MNAQSSALSSAAAVGSRAAWHSPAITIIDLKRTMFGTGAYFDGINFSTS